MSEIILEKPLFLKKKYGPLPVWGWIAVVIFVVVLAVIVTVSVESTKSPVTTTVPPVVRNKCSGPLCCNDGYYLPNNDVNYWECGSNCVGGEYLTNSSCGCACVKIPV